MKLYICSTGLRFTWLIIIIATFDLLIKQIIFNKFKLYESYHIMKSLKIVYTQNFGIAFGFLSSDHELQRWFLSIIAIIISIVLIYIMYQQSSKKYLSNFAYGFIIGGAIGNIIDRLIHGFVIDYIYFYIKSFCWPIFNFADIFISIGTFLIIFDNYYIIKNKK
ncbi:signal peptidase II [Candidatus Providencia siddallii]|uniref:Lipoprotein signal peptidase n=1 Tax=Candidatus Providencia siddallii TaxID=1715285 RepID=A0ABP1CDW4_9GAMM